MPLLPPTPFYSLTATTTSACCRCAQDSLSVRWDKDLGPYIGWAKLSFKAGPKPPAPMVHARLLYVEDTTGTPTGSLYMVGGVQRPLDGAWEGVKGWDAEPGGCPDDKNWRDYLNSTGVAANEPGYKCTAEMCCWPVEGVVRDTGGAREIARRSRADRARI